MKRIVALAGLAGLLALALFGCTMGVTIQERIQNFASDLSLGKQALRANTYMNFHPSQTQDYEALKGADPGTGDYTWDTYFPQTDPASQYTIAVSSAGDASNVIVTIEGPAEFGPAPKAAQFSMATSGLDYYIVSMWLDGNGDGTIDPGEQIIK